MVFNALEAVRNRLIGSAALTALVPAVQIIYASGTLPVIYPAIALSENLVENGNLHNMEGNFWIRMYTQDSIKDRALSGIYEIAFPLVGRKGAVLEITDANVTFHNFVQEFSSPPVHEPEVDIDTWSIEARYFCRVTI